MSVENQTSKEAKVGKNIVIVNKAVDLTPLIVKDTTDVYNRLNELLTGFDLGIGLPRIGSKEVIGFALFLRQHASRALEVSNIALAIASESDEKKRYLLRDKFLGLVGGGVKDNATRAKIPWSDEKRLSGSSVLGQDPFFMSFFYTPLLKIQEMGGAFLETIQEAERSRKATIQNQEKLAKVVPGLITSAITAKDKAKKENNEVEKLAAELKQRMVSGKSLLDPVLGEMIRKVSDLSTQASNSAVDAGKKETASHSAVTAFIPARESVKDVTELEITAYSLFARVEGNFNLTLAVYLKLVERVLEKAGQEFVAQHEEAMKRLSQAIGALSEKSCDSQIIDAEVREVQIPVLPS